MKNTKLLGSTLIIAGTTIGAGMLALPLASAGLGFTTSLLIMLGMWALMAYTALLMLELHQYSDKNATLHTLAKQFLGEKGKWVATFAMLFLFYALCAAYIAGGSVQFNQKLQLWFALDIPSEFGTVIFTAIIATIVAVGTHSVDMVNRVLFSLKIVTMIIMLTVLTPNIQQTNLLSMPIQQGLIISALPVIFTSFGFHGSIPAVVKYLDLDIKSLRKAIIIGSAMPLMIYVLWQLATLGVVSQEQLVSQQGVSALVHTLSTALHNPTIANTVSIFADLALVTSFLGVSLGLFDFLGDSIKKSHTAKGRLMVAFITFTPPLGFALFYPQGFITALGYAAIALAILAILLPVAMIRVARLKNASHENSYQAIGGKAALTIAGGSGVSIIIAQLLITFGVLPALG